jgi:hypothetical protein
MTPAKILDQQRFVWIKPESTDIMKRFERLGWIPPSKNPWFHEKWSYYRKSYEYSSKG